MQNFWSQLVTPLVATTALLSAACSDPTDPEPLTLSGNYEGYYPSYIAMTLRETNGSITGTAAVPATGTANVTGTKNGSAITLKFTSSRALPPATAPGATFQGTFAANGLTGTIATEASVSNSFTLTRVDTVAEGFGRYAVTGPLTAADSGIAVIVKRVADVAMTIKRSDGYQVQLNLPLRALTPGAYPIGKFGAAEVWGTALFNLSPFQSVSGHLNIDLARPKALAGRFTFSAEQLGGPILQISGSFSAICITSECFPSK